MSQAFTSGFWRIERLFRRNMPIRPITEALGKRNATAFAAMGQIPRSTERIIVSEQHLRSVTEPRQRLCIVGIWI